MLYYKMNFLLAFFFCLVSCQAFLDRSPLLMSNSNKVLRTRCCEQQNLAWGSVHEHFVDLRSGVCMQVLSQLPDEFDDSKPPILFLHGSFHGAWCWSEKFFDYFTSLGYPVLALSWRGTGGTYAGANVKKVKIMDHVSDLMCVLDNLPEILGSQADSPKPPVLVAHSFGGLAVMKALEKDPALASQLNGIAMMCSVPPSGNGKMTMRYLKRSLVGSYKITVGFAMKKCLKNADLCRDLFFGGRKKENDDGSFEDYGVTDKDIERYQRYFERDSKATIDLLDLAKQLPSSLAVDGVAPFMKNLPPCLVIGGSRDFIVDSVGVVETARYFNTEPKIVDSPHDVMLGAKWQNAAKELSLWLENIQFKSK